MTTDSNTQSGNGPQTEIEQAIWLENVEKVFPRAEEDVAAISGVSIGFAPASSNAIIGPSGSGKSTLLSLIGGLDRPSRGDVTILGTRLGDLKDDELADLRRTSIGFVFQNYYLIPTLTVCENVMLPLVPVRVGTLAARVRALHCIESVGLENRISHLPGELSGGEQQRVALARALVNDPAILLADEPTGNLDPDAEEVVLSLLLGLVQAEGKTVVMVSHSREVAQRCQRTVRMEQGAVVADA